MIFPKAIEIIFVVLALAWWIDRDLSMNENYRGTRLKPELYIYYGIDDTSAELAKLINDKALLTLTQNFVVHTERSDFTYLHVQVLFPQNNNHKDSYYGSAGVRYLRPFLPYINFNNVPYNSFYPVNLERYNTKLSLGGAVKTYLEAKGE